MNPVGNHTSEKNHAICPSGLARWLTVATFAIAFAWVEAAVVFYLRTMVNRMEPYQVDPLPVAGSIGAAELVREAATLLMLFSVGMLAGRSWRSRWGYAAIAFGFWDIFYYVFLRVVCGWPNSLLDWDILFLLPLPWWGPVLSPVLISLVMISWGTLTCALESCPAPPREVPAAWAFNGAGMLMALYVFMTDAIKVAGKGEEAIRQVLPVEFNWPLFMVSLLLMSMPIAALLWQWFRSGPASMLRSGLAEPSAAPRPVNLEEDLDCANRR
jgi:hypothetical protein